MLFDETKLILNSVRIENFRAIRSAKLVIDSSLGEISSRFHIDDGFADRPRIKRGVDRETGSWLESMLATERTAPILAYYRDNRGQTWGERGHFSRRTQSS